MLSQQPTKRPEIQLLNANNNNKRRVASQRKLKTISNNLNDHYEAIQLLHNSPPLRNKIVWHKKNPHPQKIEHVYSISFTHDQPQKSKAQKRVILLKKTQSKGQTAQSKKPQLFQPFKRPIKIAKNSKMINPNSQSQFESHFHTPAQKTRTSVSPQLPQSKITPPKDLHQYLDRLVALAERILPVQEPQPQNNDFLLCLDESMESIQASTEKRKSMFKKQQTLKPLSIPKHQNEFTSDLPSIEERRPSEEDSVSVKSRSIRVQIATPRTPLGALKSGLNYTFSKGSPRHHLKATIAQFSTAISKNKAHLINKEKTSLFREHTGFSVNIPRQIQKQEQRNCSHLGPEINPFLITKQDLEDQRKGQSIKTRRKTKSDLIYGEKKRVIKLKSKGEGGRKQLNSIRLF